MKTMNRRHFLGIAGKSIIAAAAAPAIVRAESIMRIKPILVPTWDVPSTHMHFGRSIYDLDPLKSQGIETGRVQVYETTQKQLDDMVEAILAKGAQPDRG